MAVLPPRDLPPQDQAEGLDPVTAIESVTINPARIIGCADRIGSLAVGKDANVVVWSGDPLDVLSRVERAFIDGAEIYTAGASPEWAELR